MHFQAECEEVAVDCERSMKCGQLLVSTVDLAVTQLRERIGEITASRLALIVPWDFDYVLDNDYDERGQFTVRQKLLQIKGLDSVASSKSNHVAFLMALKTCTPEESPV